MLFNKTNKDRFVPSLVNRSFEKMFVIAMEGEKTEPQYFTIFKSKPHVNVCLVKGEHNSDPQSVLKRMEDYLGQDKVLGSYEAWLVVDKDQRKDELFRDLENWAKKSEKHNLAISDPKFEYWLLLHFEDGNKVNSSESCTSRLKKYLPNYNKGIKVSQFTNEKIRKAIIRAEQRDQDPDNPPPFPYTTVYKLVKNILCIAKEY